MLKTIKIDPPLFKSKNKTIKRIKTPIDMSKLKEKLQINIQNRKHKTNNALNINTSASSNDVVVPQNEFTSSIQFMDKKIDNHKSSKSKVTIKSHNINKKNKSSTTFENIIENPDMNISENITDNHNNAEAK